MMRLYSLLLERILPTVQILSLDTETSVLKEDISTSIALDIKRLPPVQYHAGFIVADLSVCQSVEYCMQELILGFDLSSIVLDTPKVYPQYGREILWGGRRITEIARWRSAYLEKRLGTGETCSFAPIVLLLGSWCLIPCRS